MERKHKLAFSVPCFSRQLDASTNHIDSGETGRQADRDGYAQMETVPKETHQMTPSVKPTEAEEH